MGVVSGLDVACRDCGGCLNFLCSVARAICNPDNDEAEFAIVARSDLKGGGLGTLLMQGADLAPAHAERAG